MVFAGADFDVAARAEVLGVLQEVPLDSVVGALSVAVDELKCDDPGALSRVFQNPAAPMA